MNDNWKYLRGGARIAAIQHELADEQSKRTTKKLRALQKSLGTKQVGSVQGLRIYTSEEYAEYLRGNWWQTKRKQKLKSAGYQCFRCGAKNVMFQVHHLHYKTLGREKNTDLQVLCRPCHIAAHPEKHRTAEPKIEQVSVTIVVETTPPDYPIKTIILTKQIIQSVATGSIGFTSQQLLLLGVSIPPTKGWKKRLVGTEITTENYQQLLSLKGHCRKRKNRRK